MARLHSSLGDRTVYTIAGVAKAQGLPVTVYEDPQGTVLANLAAYDPQDADTPGAAIDGAALTVDAYSNRPAFWDLNDRDVLYVTVYGGPLEPIRPDAQPQLGDIRAEVAAETDARAAAITAAAADATAQAATAQAAATTAGVALPQRVDEIRRGKGGTIGTAGKGVISFRFDHQLDPFRTTVWPLMVARALPGSLGVVSRSVENPAASYEPTTTTWAQLKAMMNNGLEVWSHSCTHGNGTSLADEIVTSKTEIEAQGIRVMGWQQPGAPATYGTAHTTVAAMDDEAGRLIRATYGLYETSILGTNRRTLPTYGCWGHDHVTIDAMSYAAVKAVIDQAIAYRIGIQLMLHSSLVGQVGYISVADLTQVLDYVAEQRDAGTLEVLTASGLAFADPSHSSRLDLVVDGDFEGLTTAQLGYNWSQNTGSWTIRHDGGHTGNDYLHVPSTGTRCISAAGQLVNLGLDGHTFIADGWCRAPDPGGAEWRLRIRDSPNNVVLVDAHAPLAQSSDWTHVRVPFTIPRGVTIVAIEPGRWSGGGVDWDDLHAYAV